MVSQDDRTSLDFQDAGMSRREGGDSDSSWPMRRAEGWKCSAAVPTRQGPRGSFGQHFRALAVLLYPTRPDLLLLAPDPRHAQQADVSCGRRHAASVATSLRLVASGTCEVTASSSCSAQAAIFGPACLEGSIRLPRRARRKGQVEDACA